MAKDYFAMIELIWGLLSKKTGSVNKVEYVPQKPSFPKEEEYEQPLERTAPETQGVSSELLYQFLKELSEDEKMDMHHMMVLKNGKVISECSFAPYPKGMWHITHSLCKSITGMAIGMLIEEGKLSLEDRVIDIFGKRKNILGAIRQRDVTVKHLLNMTSNVSFNEAGIIWGNEWTKGFLESAVHDTPGTGFEYNSMNSYMLSAIVTELTGQSMMEYLEPRLWEPLGITKVFWETSPQKITKGGWGLFLCAEDAAKLKSAIGKSIGISADDRCKEAVLLNFTVGDMVGHSVFGQGNVLKITPMGNDNLIEVQFDKAGLKKIMANFAKLTKQ
ncbi:MAG: serine hydrolase [Lachnospiraceae bacterium]